MFRSIGTVEWVVIAFIIVFLLGSKRIPEFFKGISEAFREFKKASKDDSEKKENVG